MPHKAPSVALKNKPRPRAVVDPTKWIEETGEGSDDEDEDDDDDDEEQRSPAKRRKSMASLGPKKKAGIA